MAWGPRAPFSSSHGDPRGWTILPDLAHVPLMVERTAPPRAAPSQSPPAGWNRRAHELWLADRRPEALQLCAESLTHAAPAEPPEQLSQFAYYLFLDGQLSAAASALRRALEKSPQDLEALGNLAVVLRRLGQTQEAAGLFRKLAEAQPENVLAWDGLAAVLPALGDVAGARQAGTRSLELKDARAPAGAHWVSPAAGPGEFAADKPNVIVFSLWGDSPRYLRGALRNALLVGDVYPGWRCRFHLDGSVPDAFVRLLRDLGADIVVEPAGCPLQQRLAWRFKAAADPAVGRFLVRDADSVIGVREANAVQAWIQSGRWFHVIRDWWSHTDLILAGLWGGVGGSLPSAYADAEAYRSEAMATPNVDQWYLRDRVWPAIRDHTLVHDRFFRMEGSQPFPGAEPPPPRHVGENEFAAAPDHQDRVLAAWIETHPILRR